MYVYDYVYKKKVITVQVQLLHPCKYSLLRKAASTGLLERKLCTVDLPLNLTDVIDAEWSSSV